MTDAPDPAALARLHARAFSMPRPWNAAEFADLLAQPSVFVLTETGGFVMGRVVLDEAELLTLAVDPDQRRLGIGRGLLTGFTDEAARRGGQTAFLEVAEDNAPARALYQGAGWVMAGRRRGYLKTGDGQPVDALVLRRTIGPGSSTAAGNSLTKQ